jgi:hypothetical protein
MSVSHFMKSHFERLATLANITAFEWREPAVVSFSFVNFVRNKVFCMSSNVRVEKVRGYYGWGHVTWMENQEIHTEF